jgi:hypothetical protein
MSDVVKVTVFLGEGAELMNSMKFTKIIFQIRILHGL